MVKKKTAKLLIWLGVAGVIIPHMFFFLGLFPDFLTTLDDPSHSIFEIAMGILIIFALNRYSNK